MTAQKCYNRAMKTKSILIGLGALVIVCVCFLVPFGGEDVTDEDLSTDEQESTSVSDADAPTGRSRTRERRRRRAAEAQQEDGEQTTAEDTESESEPESTPMTEEEKREEEEEKRVDAFDDMTDKWMEPSETGVTMADVDAFAAQFRKVPDDRKEECLQRALNLVPDENVMLLAGILMDKTQDKELIELIYNDVLNRDESVKEPILKQIYADKDHPCWADTAWILDATGDQPAKN